MGFQLVEKLRFAKIGAKTAQNCRFLSKNATAFVNNMLTASDINFRLTSYR